MSAETAAVEAPEETKKLTRHAIGTTFDFVRAAAADPSVADDVPDGVTLVLIPGDDPDLARAEIDQGVAAMRRGENVYVRHIGRPNTTEAG